jgi:hypothetical protein
MSLQARTMKRRCIRWVLFYPAQLYVPFVFLNNDDSVNFIKDWKAVKDLAEAAGQKC